MKRNKGAGGNDDMQVDELSPCLREHREEFKEFLLTGKYRSKPVRRVDNPRRTGKCVNWGPPSLWADLFNKQYAKYWVSLSRNNSWIAAIVREVPSSS